MDMTSADAGDASSASVPPIFGDVAIRVEQRGRPIVHVAGEVDMHSAPALRQALDEVDVENNDLVLDLTDLQFMDSSGVGVLVGAHKRSEAAHRQLTIVCPPGPVSRVLTITGLDKVFDIVASLPEALSDASGT
jgi:anti-anti-sigma factor